jgi:hypothetical protein
MFDNGVVYRRNSNREISKFVVNAKTYAQNCAVAMDSTVPKCPKQRAFLFMFASLEYTLYTPGPGAE